MVLFCLWLSCFSAATPNHPLERGDWYIAREGAADQQHQRLRGSRWCSAHYLGAERHGQAHSWWQGNHYYLKWWSHNNAPFGHSPPCRKDAGGHSQIARFWGTYYLNHKAVSFCHHNLQQSWSDNHTTTNSGLCVGSWWKCIKGVAREVFLSICIVLSCWLSLHMLKLRNCVGYWFLRAPFV